MESLLLQEIESKIIENNIVEAFELINNAEANLFNNAEYWNLRGVLYLKVENYKTALESLEKSILIDNKNGDTYYNCAYAYEKLGYKNDAEKYYDLAYIYTNDEVLKEELQSRKMMRAKEPKTSIIALMYNHLETTKMCFKYLKKYTNFNEVEIIAVNNGSSDGTKEWLEEQDYISKKIHLDDNVGLTKGYNIGVKAASCSEIFLLANDILLTPNWLENLRACLYHEENVGIISPIMNVAAYIQSISVDYKNMEEMEEFALTYNKSDQNKWQYRTMVVTCCAFAKKEVLEKINYFDERYPAGGSYCDVDLTLTATEMGYKNYVCFDTFVHHYGSQTISKGLEANLKLGKSLFKDKKGYCGDENSGTNSLVLHLSKFIQNQSDSLIEIGTGFGISASIINYYFPKVHYIGYDKTSSVVEVSKKYLNIKHVSNYMDIPSGKKFDYVFLNGILMDKNLNQKELEYALNLTTKGGMIFGYFHNSDFIGNLKNNYRNTFTYTEIISLLKKKGYRSYDIIPNKMSVKNESKEVRETCLKLAKERNVEYEVLFTSSYLVLANK